MKVLYDYFIFNYISYGGIPRYFYELMKYYENDSEVEYELATKYTDNYYLKTSPIFKDRILPNKELRMDDLFFGKNFKGKGKIYNFIRRYTFNSFKENEKISIEALKKGDFDIFHPTYYTPYYLEYLGKKPMVMTVYDYAHEIFPEYFGNLWEVMKYGKRNLIERADMLLAISENTKKDILKFHDINPDKIKVIHLGSSLKAHKNPIKIQGLPEKYILYIGSRHIYKNFYFFITAAAELLRKDKKLFIVCGGGGNFKADELAYFDYLGIKNQVKWFNGEDETLISLYSNARFFIYPSIYEGFGIPVLEAFDCNCPMLLANASSLPEIGGDAANYFEPKDADSLRLEMEKLLNDNKLRHNLIKKGSERAKLFSLEKTALETKKVYKELLNENK